MIEREDWQFYRIIAAENTELQERYSELDESAAVFAQTVEAIAATTRVEECLLFHGGESPHDLAAISERLIDATEFSLEQVLLRSSHMNVKNKLEEAFCIIDTIEELRWNTYTRALGLEKALAYAPRQTCAEFIELHKEAIPVGSVAEIDTMEAIHDTAIIEHSRFVRPDIPAFLSSLITAEYDYWIDGSG